MADFTIQHAAEIQNGASFKVKAQHLTDNFTALKSDIDDQLDTVTTSAQTVAGPVTFSSTLTVQTPTSNGHAATKAYVDSATGGALLMVGLEPKYSTAAQWTIGTGFCKDSTGSNIMSVSSTKTVDITASGAGGLDNGSEANSTWYYLYLVGKSSDGTTAGVFSTVNESVSGSITLPSGYDLKRQLPVAIYNNSSGDLEPMRAMTWPWNPQWLYVKNIGTRGSVLDNNVVNGGTTGSAQTVSVATLVPPCSRRALVKAEVARNGGDGYLTLTDPSNADESRALYAHAFAINQIADFDIGLSSSQQLQYTLSASNLGYIWVRGFQVDGIH